MGKLIRCISEDGTLTVMAADTTDIVNRAQEIHGTSAVISAALGRLLTAASLMGSALKGADDPRLLGGRGPGGCRPPPAGAARYRGGTTLSRSG